jgi:hypothetical protein
MSKVKTWSTNCARVLVFGAITYYIAVGVKAVYFADAWYKVW